MALSLFWGITLCALFLSAGHHAVAASLGNVEIFPADNPWNTDISNYPVHPNSANFVSSIGTAGSLHPDFGTSYGGVPWGIPFITVQGSQTKVPVSFGYASESDPGPYPIPPNAPIEGGANSSTDRHVLVIDTDHKKLYELFSASTADGGASWHAGSGAIFDLTSNALRPDGWTSADAAGLPIFPGLVRYDEVAAGAITHALRFTVTRSQNKHLFPARHHAGAAGSSRPPMGLRFRLKSSVDISGYPQQARVILTALKKYGMFVADNGGNWFLSGAPNPSWNDAQINTLKGIKGSDFEAVDTSGNTPPPADTTAPAGPTHLTLTHGASTIAATWAAATDNVSVSGYRITVFRNGTALASYNNRDIGSVLTFTVTGLTASTAYEVRVVAYDAAANVSSGVTGSVTTSAVMDFTPPTGPGSVTLTVNSDSQMTASWPAATDNVGVAGYDVTVSVNADFSNPLSTFSLGTVLTKSISGLQAETRYYVRVVAFDADGNRSVGAFKDAVTSSAPTLPAPSVRFPHSMSVAGTLEIDPAPYAGLGDVSFEFSFVRNESDSSRRSGSVEPRDPQSAKSLSDPIPSAAYGFSPKAHGISPGTYTASVVAVLNGARSHPATGIVDLVGDDFSRARVFPNPWRSDRNAALPITFDGLTIHSTVKIFTVSGLHVRTLDAASGSVDWDRTNEAGDLLGSGIYLYTLTNDQGQKRRGKLAIIR